jgi:hypothetical protein
MTRRLTFGPEDAQKFDLVLTGFLQGGNALNQSNKREAHERKKEAKVLRALKGISDPVASNGKPTNPLVDNEQRQLRTGGGDVVLEQDQHEVLVKYIEACPFTTQISDLVDDLLDWLHAAPRE